MLQLETTEDVLMSKTLCSSTINQLWFSTVQAYLLQDFCNPLYTSRMRFWDETNKPQRTYLLSLACGEPKLVIASKLP